MRRSDNHVTLLLTVLMIVALMPAGTVSGEEAPGWQLEPFTADAKAVLAAAEAVPAEDDADVVVLFEEGRYQYDAQGRQRATETIVYRLLSKAAIESSWSTIEENWEPWHEERPLLEARVISPDGAVTLLDPATISESPAEEGSELFDDRQVVHGPLPAMVEGVVVEERRVRQETTAKYPEGSLHNYYPQRSIPVHHARLVVELPADAELTWISRLLDRFGVEPAREKLDGAVRYTFEHFDLPKRRDFEQHLPYDKPRTPFIGFTTGTSWQRIAARYSSLVEERINDSDGAVRAAAEQIAEATTDRRQRIAAALDLVHRQVRYTGLEFGAASIVPYRPAEVLERMYGDCKDQATLLVALLRRLDIPAQVALLRAGRGRDVEPELPGLGGFNHAIVYLPGDEPLWIDPTDTYCRLGDLPLVDQGRLALVADPETTGLLQTPPPSSADNGRAETRELLLADLGKTRMVVTTEVTGSFESKLRRTYSNLSREEIKERLEEWVSWEFLADDIAELSYTDPDDMAERLRFTVELKEAGRGFTAMNEAVAAIRWDPLLALFPDLLTEEEEEEAEDEDEGETEDEAGAAEGSDDEAEAGSDTGDDPGCRRKGDFVFHTPFHTEWRYHIVPALGYAADPLPESKTTALGSASLEERFELSEDGGVSALIRVDSGKLRLTPGEFCAMREALAELSEREPLMIRFEHTGQALLDAGRIKEALEELVSLTEKEPEKALHHARLARGLLAAGLGEEAREAARRAVEVDATSLPAHKALAWILQHDAVGRRFGAGFDLQGSLQVYRSALELEDIDLETRADYAILLEHDADGKRYGDGADLEEAITQYQALLEEYGENHVLENNLLIAQLHAGHYDEIREHADKLGKQSQTDTVVFTAVAMDEGADAAAKLIRAHYHSADERRGQYYNTAQTLIWQRHYPEAAQLMRLAAQGASNAPSILSIIPKIEATKRHEELKIDLTTPEGTVRELFRRLAPGSTASPSELFCRLTRELDGEDEPGEADRELREEFRRELAASGMPEEVGIDLALAMLELRVQGDSGPVRRVHVSIHSEQSSFEDVIFLILEDGEYRLLTLDGTEVLGAVALQLAEGGQLQAAREVLDWAWEEERSYESADPFGGPDLNRFWSRGSEGDAEAASHAATVLMIGEATADECVERLERWVAETDDPEVGDNLRVALLSAYKAQESYEKAAGLSRELLERYPESDRIFLSHCAALVELGRSTELRSVTEKRYQEKQGNEITNLRSLARAAIFEGKLDEGDSWLAKTFASDDVFSLDYNTRAWLAIIRGEVGEDATGWAHAAVDRSRSMDSASLHTLATVYAEREMPAEAYQILLQSLEVSGEDEPRHYDWYVLGRIAESFDLVDAARRYYQRVEPEENEDRDPVSTFKLAQARLAGLQ